MPESPFLDFTEPLSFKDNWVAETCAGFDVDALCELIVGRCLSVFPAEVADARFADFLRLSVHENLHVLRDLLCGRTDLSRLSLRQPLSFASVQAELKVPQNSLQRSYRVSFLTIWDEWSQSLAAEAARRGVHHDELTVALRFLTKGIFTYQDYVTSQAAENYARVDAALSRSRARVQQQLIRDLLAGRGEPLPTSDLALLEYDVHAHHVAVLLQGAGEEAAARVGRELRATTRLRETLFFKASMDCTALWIGSPTSWTPHLLDAVRDALRGNESPAAISDPHPGPAGLVQAFREAEQAEKVRSAIGISGVVRYSDVMLDILLMQDLALAEQFVRSTLGPLADDTPESLRLCETIEASLRCGSHVAAAEELGVHEHTVRNRLAKADELIGGILRARRTDLEVALRMRRLLRPTAADQP